MICRALIRRKLLLAPRTSVRHNSASSASLLDELVGSRQHIEQKKAHFSDKYKELLDRKARDEGVNDVAALRAKYQAATAARQATNRVQPAAGHANAAASTENARSVPSQQTQKASEIKGVKPLNDILDLSKASSLDASALATLWTTYHQDKGLLSAAIPIETYTNMLETAKRYPMFVLPLARQTDNNERAVEMHLTQWSFLPPAHPNAPQGSAVLFTALAEYQARQEYAQPYLILTNYADLATSHGTVLMRGEITPNVPITPTDAQLLVFRLQNFYCTNDDASASDTDKSRRELLRTFHEKPNEFDVGELVKLAQTL